jgi:hypothetical protein
VRVVSSAVRSVEVRLVRVARTAGGKTAVGFAAFIDHLGYLPFSGSVLGRIAGQLEGYTVTRSWLHFQADRPLPKASVEKLLPVRVAETRRRVR